MMVCARCGASNQTPGKFCATCGAPLAAASGPAGWPPPAQSPYGPPPAQAPAPGYPPPYAPPPPPAAAPGPPQQPGWGPNAPPAVTPGAYGPPGWAPSPPPYHSGAGAGYEPAHRVGAPDGLNPFGATMSPDQQQYPLPGPPQVSPPPAAAAAPPPAWPLQPTSPPPDARQPEPPPGPGDTRVSLAPADKPSARDPEHVAPDAPRTLAGFLINYGDSEADVGRFWPVYQGRTLIGRKEAAPGLDVEIDHATTSSRHAVIYASARPARMKIEDPGSTNGTFVNDEKLDFGTKRELSDGDIVRFGGFTAIVKIV